jgi:hypothetical protein
LNLFFFFSDWFLLKSLWWSCLKIICRPSSLIVHMRRHMLHFVKNFTEDRNIQGYHWRHEVRKNDHRQRSGPRGSTKRHALPDGNKRNG